MHHQGAAHQFLRTAHQAAGVLGTEAQPGRQGNQLIVLNGPWDPWGYAMAFFGISVGNQTRKQSKRERDGGENTLKQSFWGTYLEKRG